MRILLFILISFFLVPKISLAQKEMEKRPARTDKFIRMKGIRVGFDLTRPAQHLWNKGDRYGSEFDFDMEIAPNTFAVFETGLETQKIKHDYVDYRSSGGYSRLGVNYNFLVAEHRQDKDILYMGFRYGFTLSKQEVKSYVLDNYWQQSVGSFHSQNFSAHWAEIVLGAKVEVLRNIFLGWSIRGKIMTSYKDFDMPPVYFIPGYGKAENGFNFDFSYSISYNLPIDVLKIFKKQPAAENVTETVK